MVNIIIHYWSHNSSVLLVGIANYICYPHEDNSCSVAIRIIAITVVWITIMTIIVVSMLIIMCPIVVSVVVVSVQH